MSVVNQSNRRPFPVELFAHLEVDDDDYILDGNKVIGVMGNPLPTAIDDEAYEEPEEIERLLKKGYEVQGYEGYSINKQGIPVRSVETMHGYPQGSLSIDVFECVYFEGICIGTFVYGGLVPAEKEDLNRLSELHVEHKYLYGSQEGVSTWALTPFDNETSLLINYTLSPSGKVVTPKEKLIVKQIDQSLYVAGQLSLGSIIPLTLEQFEHYTALGFKILVESMIKPTQLDPVVLPWFAKKGLYCEMGSNLIVKLGANGKYVAVGSRREDAFVPLSEAERKLAQQYGFLLE